MIYFPFLRVPGFDAWVDLHNFAPNSWEMCAKTKKQIHVTWLEGQQWRSEYIGDLEYGKSATISECDLPQECINSSLIIASLSEERLPLTSQILPIPMLSTTAMPAWRATLGIASNCCSASYQGEITAFPSNGSLLSFSTFIQENRSAEILNYLLLLNLEELPVSRLSYLNVFNSAGESLIGSLKVITNSLNIIPIQQGILNDDLIIFSCTGMSGIPVFISSTLERNCISIEHTHPPASLGINGNRWALQKSIKDKWFKKFNTKLKK